MTEQFDIVQVIFINGWNKRTYNYIAPHAWDLRVGDKVQAPGGSWAEVVGIGPASNWTGPYRMLMARGVRKSKIDLELRDGERIKLLELVRATPTPRDGELANALVLLEAGLDI